MYIRTENGELISFGKKLIKEGNKIYMVFSDSMVEVYASGINVSTTFEWLIKRIGMGKNTDMRVIKSFSDMADSDPALKRAINANSAMYMRFLEFAYGRTITLETMREYFAVR